MRDPWFNLNEASPIVVYGARVTVRELLESKDVGPWCVRCKRPFPETFCGKCGDRLTPSPMLVPTTLLRDIAEVTDLDIYRFTDGIDAYVGRSLDVRFPLELTPNLAAMSISNIGFERVLHGRKLAVWVIA